MSETSSLSALCQFEKTDVGATLMGTKIRVDDTGEFLSVKDAIMVIEGCTSNAAKLRMNKLINDKIISEATNPDFRIIMDGSYRYVI
jgi:hypothetical protein